MKCNENWQMQCQAIEKSIQTFTLWVYCVRVSVLWVLDHRNPGIVNRLMTGNCRAFFSFKFRISSFVSRQLRIYMQMQFVEFLISIWWCWLDWRCVIEILCVRFWIQTHTICRLDETTTTLTHSDSHSHKHTQHSIRKTAFKTIQVKVTHFEFNWLL